MTKKSFTLIEILVVITIIVLLTASAVVTYSIFLKQSRDASRKANLEQIRAALELYRSNNDAYPNTLNDLLAPVTYMQSLPTDPKKPTYSYYYLGQPADYTLAAYLENGGTACVNNQCGGNCNYCVGPYGQK